MSTYNEELGMHIPDHIAIILDGNGRWAKKRGLPKSAGHSKGAEVYEEMARFANSIGVKYMTVYAFSTENWKRSSIEVAALMKIFKVYIGRILRSDEDNFRFRFIGDRSGFDDELRKLMAQAEEKTRDYEGITLSIALNYGGRDEIRRAVKRIATDVADGRVNPDSVDDALIASYLDTAGIPDPDLLIRPSGEQRISNFLLWQLAYTEMYFPEVLWPDFKKEDLIEAIRVYNTRDRRFGGRNDEKKSK